MDVWSVVFKSVWSAKGISDHLHHYATEYWYCEDADEDISSMEVTPEDGDVEQFPR